MTELNGRPEPTLDQLLDELSHAELDLVIVEGFKFSPIPKLELRRAARPTRPLYPEDDHVIAIVCDDPGNLEPVPRSGIDILDINAPSAVTDYLIDRFLPATR